MFILRLCVLCVSKRLILKGHVSIVIIFYIYADIFLMNIVIVKVNTLLFISG
jgi:hypothetical protein